ncbi:MAG: hypothetical protein NWR03_14895 [Akkermansiaceae bacterium]|nr:hypothetical protein [Akkermansiaceae bacterium]
MTIIQKFTLLFALVSFATPALAEHPIPQDSTSPWDYRGEPRTITRESHDALFSCKTYEELAEALIVAIKDLEHEPDCSAPVYVASGCRLALIRAYYIMGDTEKADKLLQRYAAVYRKQDGTPDFGEAPQEDTENNKPNKAEMATPNQPSD